MDRSTKKRAAILGSFLILVGLFAVNALVGMTVRFMRIDLTQGDLYSLSPGIRPLVRDLEEQVQLDFYFSQEATTDLPQFRGYAQRVREFLEELVLASGGQLVLNVYDPEPYSEAEDAARAAQLAALRIDGVGRELTLGLVVRNAVDEQEVIPYLDPGQEAFLEYEVARAILGVSRRDQPRVGFLSSIPMDAQYNPSNPRQMVPEWRILTEIRDLYALDMIDPMAVSLPDDLDVLVLVHPRNLGEAMLLAIDDHALGGGRILAFLDPWCESDPAAQAGANPLGQGPSGTRSDLGGLLGAWGVSFTSGQVIGDKDYAQRVQARTSGGLQVMDYIVWLGLEGAALDPDDPVTGSLGRMNLATAGSFSAAGSAASTMEPLVTSSSSSMLIDSARLGVMADPASLLRDFTASGTEHVIAARITGSINSAFNEQGADSVEGAEVEALEPRSGIANIILVGDVDMLQDQNWIMEERLGPISLGWRTVADNGSFVLNALEVLSGDQALLSLRGRGAYSRPFHRVRELRQAAENRYLAREQELQDSIRTTEQRIQDLQREKTSESMLILSPEQEAEVSRLQESVIDARRELRQVRFNLQKDIETLGQRLMVMNVVVWPLLVACAALWWSINRLRRQRGRKAA